MAIAGTPVQFIMQWLQNEPGLKPGLEHPPFAWGGGWERWAQGQITIFMGQQGYQVWTEQHIYSNIPTQAVDLEFRPPPGVPVIRSFLELKCYSEVSEETDTRFIKRVLEDWYKIQQPLTAYARGSPLWVVAITQEQFREGFLSARNRVPDWQGFQYVTVACFSGGRGTFDIWYRGFINNN